MSVTIVLDQSRMKRRYEESTHRGAVVVVLLAIMLFEDGKIMSSMASKHHVRMLLDRSYRRRLLVIEDWEERYTDLDAGLKSVALATAATAALWLGEVELPQELSLHCRPANCSCFPDDLSRPFNILQTILIIPTRWFRCTQLPDARSAPTS